MEKRFIGRLGSRDIRIQNNRRILGRFKERIWRIS